MQSKQGESVDAEADLVKCANCGEMEVLLPASHGGSDILSYEIKIHVCADCMKGRYRDEKDDRQGSDRGDS